MTAPTISATPKKPLISGRHPPVLLEATSVSTRPAHLRRPAGGDPLCPLYVDSGRLVSKMFYVENRAFLGA